MFKFLPPPKGLWHIGEQCGVDCYMDMDSYIYGESTDKFFEVDMLEFPTYQYSMFNGLPVSHARKWIEENKKKLL